MRGVVEVLSDVRPLVESQHPSGLMGELRWSITHTRPSEPAGGPGFTPQLEFCLQRFQSGTCLNDSREATFIFSTTGENKQKAAGLEASWLFSGQV